MKVYKDVEQKSEKWHELRQGKITGTVLKNILGTPVAREKAFYDILAERLSVEASQEESALDRGLRLEDEAIEKFGKETGLEIERVGFIERDDCKWIGNSPDGLVMDKGKYVMAVEVKCLSSSNHIKAFLEHEIPKEYRAQGIQYFCVNDDLESLVFVFYDPRITEIPLHTITMNRKEIEEEIKSALEKEREFIEEVETALAKIILK